MINLIPRISIVFAIISSLSKELEIHSFSKVSLRNAKRRLETYGYKVSLQKIGVEKKRTRQSELKK
jgi:uncharacterized protein (TIGR04141 family)